MDYYYLFFLPITICIGGLMTFIFAKRWHQLHDKINLVLLVSIVITCYTTIRALAIGTSDYTFLILDNLQTLSGLSMCPLCFLYIRTLTHTPRWHTWYWWLFAPAVMLCIAGTTLSFIVGWDRILEIRLSDYSPFTPNPDSPIEKLYQLINIQLFNITLELMAVVLIVLSVLLLIRYHKKVNDYYANLEDSCISNIQWFLASVIAFFIVIFLVTYYISTIITLGNDVRMILSSLLSAISVTIIYNAYNIRMTEQHKEVCDDSPHISSVPVGNTLSDTLGEKITHWESRKDKPFCKEGITLVELAKDLGVTRQSLSAYINTQKGTNFNQWINTLRIEEAKRLLVISTDLKIGYISGICGFGTQSAFTKTFHRIVGCSPQTYRQTTLENKEK